MRSLPAFCHLPHRLAMFSNKLPPSLPPQAKAKIMVVKDVEREDIEFISKVGWRGWLHLCV